MADRGFPLTRTMVKAFAWTLAKRSGNGDHFNAETGPGKHWWTNFKSGHPCEGLAWLIKSQENI